MSPRHVVVDGSNIATEGRSLPSLAQLDEAVREFRREFPDDVITVVVDATFGHRIDPSELDAFKEAEAHNEVVSPPAGAIGRGDAFLLRIAEKVGATVLSNDSFQEFHGEHDWVFEKGRLIGGKPVPGVGWIFTPRTPVRGPKSREAVKVAKRAKKAAAAADSGFETLEEEVAARRARGGRAPAGSGAAAKKAPAKVAKAIALATEEAVEPDSASARRRRRRRSGSGTPPAEPVNAPLAFINFVSEHRLGSEVDGVVDRFSSHGAFVSVGEAQCYIPLSAMGEPPPRAARDVLRRGETRTFVIQAFDPPRRGIELALPGFAHVAAAPTDETVEDEIAEGAVHEEAAAAAAPAPAPAKRARKRTAKKAAAEAAEAEAAAPAKRTRKRAAKQAPAAQAAEAAVEAARDAGVAGESGGEATAPAKPARKRAAKKAAPETESARPVRKQAAKTAAPVAEPAPAAPARKRTAKKAAPEAAEPTAKPARRPAKTAASAEPVASQPARRAAKQPAAEPAGPAPARRAAKQPAERAAKPASRARKKAAAEPVEAPAKKAARTRKASKKQA